MSAPPEAPHTQSTRDEALASIPFLPIDGYCSADAMDINPRLYVEIHPVEGEYSPHPHPVRDAHFDTKYVYKVLGMYNPSETSECYFVLANPARQIWFIPQRHLLAYRLIDSDEFFLERHVAEAIAAQREPRNERAGAPRRQPLAQ